MPVELPAPRNSRLTSSSNCGVTRKLNADTLRAGSIGSRFITVWMSCGDALAKAVVTGFSIS